MRWKLTALQVIIWDCDLFVKALVKLMESVKRGSAASLYGLWLAKALVVCPHEGNTPLKREEILVTVVQAAFRDSNAVKSDPIDQSR